MNELQQILEKISELASGHSDIRLATLVIAEGSTYRDVGARMIIDNNGYVNGSISGGCLEGDVVQSAIKMDTDSVLKEYDTTSEEDIYWGTGMGCGGKTTVFIEKLKDVSLYLKLKELLTKRVPGVAVTVFQAEDPALIGLQIVSDGKKQYSRNVGLKTSCVEYVNEVMKKRRSVIRGIEYAGQKIQALFEFVEPIQQIALFGDGFDVLPVIKVCKQLGWQVHIIAAKEALAVKERFPAAATVNAWRGSESLPDYHTPCIIMTHNYLLDKEILRILLPSGVPYIGFLGPKKRGARLLKEVLEEGLEVSREQLDRYYSPIGLDIGAASAEEIAVSVVAEVLSVLRNRRGGNLRDRQGPIHGRKAVDQ